MPRRAALAVAALAARVPNARIWSVDAPQYLVLAKQANPTRYQLFSGGLGAEIDDTWPGGLDAFVAWNRARQPDLVAVNGLELAVGHWTSRLRPDYVRVGYSPGAFWFARTSLGPQVLRALRAEPSLQPPVRLTVEDRDRPAPRGGQGRPESGPVAGPGCPARPRRR